MRIREISLGDFEFLEMMFCLLLVFIVFDGPWAAEVKSVYRALEAEERMVGRVWYQAIRGFWYRMF